jgi:hypothetical protein
VRHRQTCEKAARYEADDQSRQFHETAPSSERDGTVEHQIKGPRKSDFSVPDRPTLFIEMRAMKLVFLSPPRSNPHFNAWRMLSLCGHAPAQQFALSQIKGLFGSSPSR